MFVAFAIFEWAVEWVAISIGIYQYHQQDKYLLAGVAWSNLWLLGGYFTLAYVSLAHMRRWLALPARPGISFSQETTWKAVYMGVGAIIVPAFTLGMFQLWWYAATSPWTESGRPF
jgi:hypothetical protein